MLFHLILEKKNFQKFTFEEPAKIIQRILGEFNRIMNKRLINALQMQQFRQWKLNYLEIIKR